MIRRSVALLVAFIFIIAVGCSTQGPKAKPGTGGTSSAKTIGKTAHPAVPEGVRCYVCHKREIPTQEFHAKYGADCEECHIKSTWMATKYSHPGWLLTGPHKPRCTRCHTKMSEYDFSYQCWGCHHDKALTEKSHADKGITDIANCAECHKDVKLGSAKQK